MFNVERNVEEIVKWLQNYLETSKAKGFVLGISGGKDSAVVASLLVKAVGPKKVFGVLMPNGTQKDIDDSIKVCEGLNIEYTTVNIESAYNAMLEILPSTNVAETKVNIQPRLRMTTLYAVASEKGYLVAGTGNKSEKYVGYFTKWGDGAYDINPIGDFNTVEVVKIGEYLNSFSGAIHKAPSDGISGTTDEDKLGFTYGQVNEFMENGHIEDKNIESKIITKHNQNKHKSEPVPIFKKL